MNAKQSYLLNRLSRRDQKIKIRWEKRLDTPANITGNLSEPFSGNASKMVETAAKEFLDDNKYLFSMKDPNKELKLRKKVIDSAGNICVAFQQEHNGVSVFGGTVRVQYSKSNILTRVANKYQPQINVDTKPQIDADAAVQKAISDAGGGTMDNYFPPKLIIYENNGNWYLVWMLRVDMTNIEKPKLLRYFINAKDGSVIHNYNDFQSFPYTTGQGRGYYSGTGSIDVYKASDTKYQLIDNSRKASGGPTITISDCNGAEYPSTSYISEDSNNNWDSTTSSPRKDHQGPEVDAMRYIAGTVDYFKNTHNWNSFDNNGTDLLVGVHASNNWNNAQWLGSGQIRFGDGNGSTRDYYTANDVACHEFTHGIVESTAGLLYEKQSGAMNESFCDIFGSMYDRTDVTQGEDYYTPGTSGDASRYLNDPAKGGQIDHYLKAYDSHNTGYTDTMDVHYTSGLLNYACYCLLLGATHPKSGISVSAIGYEKTEKIFFHALTAGLSGNDNATFLECREAALNAVDSLYKSDLDYLKIIDSVKNAFTAVGIGPDIYVRDSLTDTGITPSVGTLYMSPDIITSTEQVVNPQTAFGDLSNANLGENVEYGQDNYVYVRLQNRGAVSGDVDLKVYWSDPSSFSNPGNWHLIGSATATDVNPGVMKVIGPIKWNKADISGPGHFCLVAELDDQLDPAPDKSLITTGEMYNKFISCSNNFAWKNINVVDFLPESTADLEFMMQAPKQKENGDLHIDLSGLPGNSEVSIRILKRLCEGIEVNGLSPKSSSTRYNNFNMTPGMLNTISNIPFLSNDISEVHIYAKFPENATGIYSIPCIQRFNEQAVSRITLVMNLLNASSFEFIGNRSSMEIHKKDCEWVAKMSKSNYNGFHTIEHAQIIGYDNCAFCIGNSKR